MIDYARILAKKYSGSDWVLDGDAYEGLVWKSTTPKPTQDELDALWPIVQSEIKAEADAKIAARNSALTKLGLTADEVAALFG